MTKRRNKDRGTLPGPPVTTADLIRAGEFIPMEVSERSEQEQTLAGERLEASKTCGICGKPAVAHDWTFHNHSCADHAGLLPSEFRRAAEEWRESNES
jgi:hypothetical protein